MFLLIQNSAFIGAIKMNSHSRNYKQSIRNNIQKDLKIFGITYVRVSGLLQEVNNKLLK